MEAKCRPPKVNRVPVIPMLQENKDRKGFFDWSFLNLWRKPLSLSVNCWRGGGYPSRVSRKGKASPLEAGRGRYSPPASPERVTSKAGEVKGQGFSLIKNRI